MNITCSVCKEKTTAKKPHPATIETGICEDCRRSLGIVPMGEPSRPPHPCMRCAGKRFTRVIPRELSRQQGDTGGAIAAPMTATWESVDHGIFSANPKIDIEGGKGILEIYLCHGCGFVEWYCRDVAAIPIGPAYMSEVLDYEPAPGYR